MDSLREKEARNPEECLITVFVSGYTGKEKSNEKDFSRNYS